jgi:hypothetical protein
MPQAASFTAGRGNPGGRSVDAQWMRMAYQAVPRDLIIHQWDDLGDEHAGDEDWQEFIDEVLRPYDKSDGSNTYFDVHNQSKPFTMNKKNLQRYMDKYNKSPHGTPDYYHAFHKYDEDGTGGGDDTDAGGARNNRRSARQRGGSVRNLNVRNPAGGGPMYKKTDKDIRDMLDPRKNMKENIRKVIRNEIAQYVKSCEDRRTQAMLSKEKEEEDEASFGGVAGPMMPLTKDARAHMGGDSKWYDPPRRRTKKKSKERK